MEIRLHRRITECGKCVENIECLTGKIGAPFAVEWASKCHRFNNKQIDGDFKCWVRENEKTLRRGDYFKSALFEFEKNNARIKGGTERAENWRKK